MYQWLLSENYSKDRNVPWLQSDCRIGRPGDVLSRACLQAYSFDFAKVSSPRRKSKIKTSRRLFPLPWKLADARVLRYGTMCDARTRELGDKAREIFDATRFVRIPTKSLTLRIVTRVIWLRCNSRFHGYTTERSVSRFRFCFGRQLNVPVMNKRLIPPYPPSSHSPISIGRMPGRNSNVDLSVKMIY